jgi:hypothetical protein
LVLLAAFAMLVHGQSVCTLEKMKKMKRILGGKKAGMLFPKINFMSFILSKVQTL